MNKASLLIIVCPAFLVGCATVQMPELSPSHPAHPEAEAASVSTWPSILQLPDQAVVAPPLPIHTDGGGVAPSLESHPDHSTTAVDVGSGMYACPMDPEVRSDSPGSCSKCGMALVKKGGD